MLTGWIPLVGSPRHQIRMQFQWNEWLLLIQEAKINMHSTKHIELRQHNNSAPTQTFNSPIRNTPTYPNAIYQMQTIDRSKIFQNIDDQQCNQTETEYRKREMSAKLFSVAANYIPKREKQ
jgi:hypothetical protein